MGRGFSCLQVFLFFAAIGCGLCMTSYELDRLRRTRRSSALPGEFPYQAALFDVSGDIPILVCGATVYTKTDVITAANCVYEQEPTRFEIVAGDFDMDVDDGSEYFMEVLAITVHKLYDVTTGENDIAMLHLVKPLNVLGPIQSASDFLPSMQVTGPCHLSGWGFTEVDGVMPSKLEKLSVSLLPPTECQAVYGPNTPVASTLCVSMPDVAITSCDEGLRGSPLTCYDEDDTPLMSGFVSWAMHCGQRVVPWLYTDTAYYQDWIEQYVNYTAKVAKRSSRAKYI